MRSHTSFFLILIHEDVFHANRGYAGRVGSLYVP